MPTNISGLNGIDTIQDGVITPADLNTAVNPAVQRIQTFTAQVATGSNNLFDFGGIPSWAKEITVMFNNLSTTGTALIQVQLNAVATGYTSAAMGFGPTTGSASSVTTGFPINTASTAANSYSGSMIISNVSGNNWVASSTVARNAAAMDFGAGVVTLGSVLTSIRITANGTDAFDQGSVNILVKG